MTPSTSDRLSTLRRKRGNIKATITNLATLLESESENRNIHYIQATYETMQKAWKKFEDIQDDIEELDESEVEQRGQYIKSHDTTIAKMRELGLDPTQPTPRRISDNSPQVSAPPITMTPGLPIMSLPTFDGSPEEWSSFYDLFTSLLGSNKVVTSVQKLQYLRGSLRGSASATISSLETTDKNYDVAISLLKEKYECKRATYLRHWNTLHEVPRLQKDTPAAFLDLLDIFNQHIRGLENLGAPVNKWDIPLVHLILSKLSQPTTRQWQLSLPDNNMPSYEHLLKFLKQRANCSDIFSTQSNQVSKGSERSHKLNSANSHRTQPPHNQIFLSNNHILSKCPICKESHMIYKCQKFKSVSIDERIQMCKEALLCFNCLSPNHQYKNCNSGSCRVCHKRHNTLLHKPNNSQQESYANAREQNSSVIQEQSIQQNLDSKRPMSFLINSTTSELMATASAYISNKDGPPMLSRCLLDTCSTTNFMTERLADSLGLKKEKCSVPIGALNSLTTMTKYLVRATLHSRVNNYQKEFTFLTIPHISEAIPDQPVNRTIINIPANLKLADPEFHQPAPIDVLFGTGPTLSLLCVGQVNLTKNKQTELYMQKTRLGWIIGGSAPAIYSSQNRSCHATTELQLDLAKFWELEEETTYRHFTQDETACELHFQKHVARQADGRYIVALPFNEKISQLGESRNRAFNRFKSLERRLNRNSDLKQKYKNVLDEYRDLGHMTMIQIDQTNDNGCYLPHHAVIKESSQTTKVRVVFDGLAETSTGISLNESLRIGPTIQSDLFSLLLRFRLHQYVITGDIEKMYRQFLVRPEDRKFQKILWRNDEGVVETFELNTVTFGLSSAPFLAIRCLLQLAEDESKDFPLATRALKEDMYVDDVLTGAPTRLEALQIRNELIQSLQRGKLHVRQWASNDPELLKDLPESSLNLQLQLGDSSPLKTLGIYWDSAADSILYKVNTTSTAKHVSKRTILSETAKIFDPLGLLGPVVTTAKILIQRLWALKLEWDESLPISIHTEWSNFYNKLPLLNDSAFKRGTLLSNYNNIQLHGFCDASQKAYGACVYLRTINDRGEIHTELLCSKSRVAPLKSTTIPRLELCGALLLSKLISNIQHAIHININQIICWTDSTIVLHWLRTPPQRLKTFVANRVAEIQAKSDINNWFHVRTNDNPADLLSRGQTPEHFVQPSIWKNGPSWLKKDEECWPRFDLIYSDEPPEQRKLTCLMSENPKTFETAHHLIRRYSSIDKLRRVIAYCLRFKNKQFKGKLLNTAELSEANRIILVIVQREVFSNELHCLSKNQSLLPKSKLLKLNPFVHTDGIIRVGGRLANATIPFSECHPIILPRDHHVTTLLINNIHHTHLHAGVQATLYSVRRCYWPIDGRSQVWKTIRSCLKCSKYNPSPVNYIMGDLPRARVNESRPFSHVGVDYCGPFLLKQRKFRNRSATKIYVAIFVCLAIKAVHLEVVSDLSSDGFIAAFRRFTARRGNCAHIYSDNGTNFVGAHKQIKETQEWLNNHDDIEKIYKFFTSKSITWHFIPPASPNFGGLWEAGVKSFKYHLKRVAGKDLLFTFEEFVTLTTEIEAILNSRPLTPISSDPNDPLVLTPGHFLIGDPLTNLPDKDYSDIPGNRLSVWQHLQKIKRDFWKRWHKEYLNELTQRSKWNKGQHHIALGTVVLIREENVPPSHWILGRVIDVHPGLDGIIRTVTVKTAVNTLKRNVRKLAPLPIQQEKD